MCFVRSSRNAKTISVAPLANGAALTAAIPVAGATTEPTAATTTAATTTTTTNNNVPADHEAMAPFEPDMSVFESLASDNIDVWLDLLSATPSATDASDASGPTHDAASLFAQKPQSHSQSRFDLDLDLEQVPSSESLMGLLPSPPASSATASLSAPQSATFGFLPDAPKLADHFGADSLGMLSMQNINGLGSIGNFGLPLSMALSLPMQMQMQMQMPVAMPSFFGSNPQPSQPQTQSQPQSLSTLPLFPTLNKIPAEHADECDGSYAADIKPSEDILAAAVAPLAPSSASSKSRSKRKTLAAVSTDDELDNDHDDRIASAATGGSSLAIKRARNNEAARRSRERKMKRLGELEVQVRHLETEKSDLHVRLAVLENERKSWVARERELSNRVLALESQLSESHRALMQVGMTRSSAPAHSNQARSSMCV